MEDNRLNHELASNLLTHGSLETLQRGPTFHLTYCMENSIGAVRLLYLDFVMAMEENEAETHREISSLVKYDVGWWARVINPSKLQV